MLLNDRNVEYVVVNTRNVSSRKISTTCQKLQLLRKISIKILKRQLKSERELPNVNLLKIIAPGVNPAMNKIPLNEGITIVIKIKYCRANQLACINFHPKCRGMRSVAGKIKFTLALSSGKTHS